MKVKLAAIQCAFNTNRDANVLKICQLIETAAGSGAQIILPPELFEGPYFPKIESEEFFAWARPLENHPTIEKIRSLCLRYKIVVPVSFFEKAGQEYYNSIVVVDGDGKVLDLYRKSHIPDGPGYEEKFYFKPGNTGFKVWNTQFGRIGIGICWDQWFPECARALTLMGAEMILYPTAIGSEPQNPTLNTKDLWQRAMIGHSVCNMIPVVASNRIGTEEGQKFYGHSFITNHRGDKLAEASDHDEQILYAEIDLTVSEKERAAFGFFRDRRPGLYKVISE